MGVGSDSIPSRLERGEAVDVVIVADDALNELIKNGRVLADSRVALARSGIGMAVRAGTPKPDISSVDALTRTLLQAKSIAYSASVSGRYLTTELFQRLGIADQVLGKSRRIDLERVGAVVARGEAEIGFQQISELLPEPGIDYVGPLPPEVQRVTVFSAGVAAGSKNADAARALIRFLASSEAAGTVAKSGLEPRRPRLNNSRHPRARRAQRQPSTRCWLTPSHAEIFQAWSRWSRIAAASCTREPSGWPTPRSGRPMTVDTIFRIASMTKPVTSLAVMQLVEQGRLSLDDPAEKYLPQLANLKVFETFDAKTGAYTLRPAKRAPTVRHMLTHTAGLGYNFTSPIVRDFKPRAGEAYVAGPLLFDPGEQWLYSTGIDWGGRIVEALSGKNLEVYFRDHIFGPLGMVDTVLQPAGRSAAPLHRRASASSGRHVSGRSGSTADVGGTADRRRRTRLDGAGLYPLPSDAAQSGNLERRPHCLCRNRRRDGPESHRQRRRARGEDGDARAQQRLHVRRRRSRQVGHRVHDHRRRQAGRRSAGSLSWGGLNNTYFWVDPARGVAGVILMQYLPFADSKALAVYDAFERAVYELKRVD